MREKKRLFVTRYSLQDGQILLFVSTDATVLSDGVDSGIALFWSSSFEQENCRSSESVIGISIQTIV